MSTEKLPHWSIWEKLVGRFCWALLCTVRAALMISLNYLIHQHSFFRYVLLWSIRVSVSIDRKMKQNIKSKTRTSYVNWNQQKHVRIHSRISSCIVQFYSKLRLTTCLTSSYWIMNRTGMSLIQMIVSSLSRQIENSKMIVECFDGYHYLIQDDFLPLDNNSYTGFTIVLSINQLTW